MSKLKVRVDYYNPEHEKAFSKYSNYDNIRRIAGNVIEIEQSEFLTYMVFTEQKDFTGFRTYTELSTKATDRCGFFKDYLDFSGESIRSKLPHQHIDDNIRERIGVAGSLCIVNKIHELTEADWECVPEQGGKKAQMTTDYKMASDGSKFVFVESKGSALENNKLKKSTISQHKKSIEDKKEVSRKSENNNLYYGVISVIDDRPDSILQSWLVDPPPPEYSLEPYRYKLLSRLYFYWRNLKFITPNSSVLLALINRINVLKIVRNFSELDGIHFLNRNGSTMEAYPNSFSQKSFIERINIVGRLYHLKDAYFLFVGFPTYIYDLLISQKFEHINRFKYFNGTITEVLTCRINKEEIKLLNLSEEKLKRFRKVNDNILELKVEGEFYFNESGRVFSIIDLSNNS